MPVLKTESRLPAGLQAQDLGEAVSTPDGKASLISFMTSVLVQQRENQYVVFITDTAMGVAVAGYEWSVMEGAGAPVITTGSSSFFYSPVQLGPVTVSVRVLDGGNNELAQLSLSQDIVEASEELETMIAEAVDEPGPVMGHPDVLRELINEHNPYYQAVTLQTPEAGEGFQKFVFHMVFEGALRRTAAERKQHLAELAAALNTGTTDFAQLSAQGAGVSLVRFPLLAMTLPGMVPWTFLPEQNSERAVAEETLRGILTALTEAKKIDLYNLVRFPKSNIKCCGRVLEELRNRYFNGTSFDDVLTGSNGTRAQWMMAQYRVGPIERH
jgi:hypothetical protein